ncbi:PREDICTED: apoptosis-associated speck-like protein containing a CARD isoform X2 [Mandrillus leucophaeus]|uniref:Apoptosis-associated speck-like protein containing a CARD n=1 Tax=Mandrillus leucophaeus TaxID=9568 RepID=A0A2K5XN41_MANLE|nr:PREDICTED: apoptosis-associated speck-like protein containing a CARD isoform X2 [Mandrillus leucophaeus]
MGRARDAILEALENLTAEELKKFKLKLLSVPLREGYGRIPRGALLSMDALDLTDKLVSFYLEAYGAELTANVLRDMGLQETARQLQAATHQGLHFVDLHRAALIARVTDVEGLLDALYGTVLKDQQYQEVQAESTNPSKMRKLFSFMPAWNWTCKDLFLQALRETQSYLVEDLERS